MAHVYQQGLAKNTADLLIKLRDFMSTTAGWTLVQDTVTTGATGQYFVVSSTGESGNEKIVLRFHRQAANAINVYSYLSWSAGNGRVLAGSTSITSGTGTYLQTDDNQVFPYWWFASKDRVVGLTRAGHRAGVSDTFYAGIYSRAKAAAFATTVNAEAAGANVVVEVNTTAPFQVGSRYVIADDNGFEYPKVTAIAAGVSITVDLLQNSYLAGARIGEDVRPTIVLASTTGLGVGSGSHWHQAPPDRGGLAVALGASQILAGAIVVRGSDVSLIEQTSPEGLPDVAKRYWLWPFHVADSTQQGGYLGQLAEVFQTSRALSDDSTITLADGRVYHFLSTASPVTGSGSTALGLAVRRA
jgi:hypothetical protein